jgi:hypothetical protein
MSANTVPSGFKDVEEWLLNQLYENPKANHLTHSLLQQLSQVLQSEPSSRDMVNELRSAMGSVPLSAEDYGPETERNVEFGEVQRAVEALIEAGWAKGDRNRNADGVYYTGLKLTNKGEAEAIRRKREREKRQSVLDGVSTR